MREETSEQPTNFTHDAIVEDRFIGRIDLTPLIVRTVDIPVKYVAILEICSGTADRRRPVGACCVFHGGKTSRDRAHDLNLGCAITDKVPQSGHGRQKDS
jgi:hypothetical protein